jgi:hypothetical protein
MQPPTLAIAPVIGSLDRRWWVLAGRPRCQVGSLFAGVALVLTAVRYEVDGVTLKLAVDAWAIAPDSEKAARFASAEAIRWLEEAISSYQGFVLGVALILLAALIVWTGRVPKLVGYILGLSGVAYLVLGWINGAMGFASQGAIPAMLGQFCWLVSDVWLLIAAWRVPQSGGAVIEPSA